MSYLKYEPILQYCISMIRHLLICNILYLSRYYGKLHNSLIYSLLLFYNFNQSLHLVLFYNQTQLLLLDLLNSFLYIFSLSFCSIIDMLVDLLNNLKVFQDQTKNHFLIDTRIIVLLMPVSGIFIFISYRIVRVSYQLQIDLVNKYLHLFYYL